MELPKRFLKKEKFIGLTKRFQISDIRQQEYFKKDKTRYKAWCMVVTGDDGEHLDDFEINWLFVTDFLDCLKMWGSDEQQWKGNLVDITSIPDREHPEYQSWKFMPVPKEIKI